MTDADRQYLLDVYYVARSVTVDTSDLTSFVTALEELRALVLVADAYIAEPAATPPAGGAEGE